MGSVYSLNKWIHSKP